ncbi:hypothetical protein [Schlesneria paludicola]|uniref:hypothetical protein n=1 Tax=Schlesneria paludicola TaxID=360056 RepID=UPI00029AE879|nr:hypothetical protein [Schlesneria paludicola]
MLSPTSTRLTTLMRWLTVHRSFSSERLASDITISAIIGGGIGAACYVFYGLLFEQFVMPKLRPPEAPFLSYGQQCGMISTPLAAFLGVGVGVSIALLRRWGLLVASVITIPIPLLVAFAATKLWESNFRRYGADPSDWILYTPLLVGSAICFAWNIAIAVVGCLRLFVQSTRMKISEPIVDEGM